MAGGKSGQDPTLNCRGTWGLETGSDLPKVSCWGAHPGVPRTPGISEPCPPTGQVFAVLPQAFVSPGLSLDMVSGRSTPWSIPLETHVR